MVSGFLNAILKRERRKLPDRQEATQQIADTKDDFGSDSMQTDAQQIQRLPDQSHSTNAIFQDTKSASRDRHPAPSRDISVLSPSSAQSFINVPHINITEFPPTTDIPNNSSDLLQILISVLDVLPARLRANRSINCQREQMAFR